MYEFVSKMTSFLGLIRNEILNQASQRAVWEDMNHINAQHLDLLGTYSLTLASIVHEKACICCISDM